MNRYTILEITLGNFVNFISTTSKGLPQLKGNVLQEIEVTIKQRH